MLLLIVPGGKVTYLREKIPLVLRALAVSRVCSCTADSASTRSISRFCTSDTSGLAVFRGSLQCILPWTSKHFGILYCVRVLQALAVFRPLILLVLRVLLVRKYPHCAQYARSMKYTVIRLSVHRVDNLMSIVLQKKITDGPTRGRWSKLLSVGATGVLERTGSISGLHTASAPSISRFCTADTACTPSMSRFDTAGTACTLHSVLLILPVLAVFRPPVLKYCQYSEYDLYSILPSILGVNASDVGNVSLSDALYLD